MNFAVLLCIERDGSNVLIRISIYGEVCGRPWKDGVGCGATVLIFQFSVRFLCLCNLCTRYTLDRYHGPVTNVRPLRSKCRFFDSPRVTLVPSRVNPYVLRVFHICTWIIKNKKKILVLIYCPGPVNRVSNLDDKVNRVPVLKMVGRPIIESRC